MQSLTHRTSLCFSLSAPCSPEPMLRAASFLLRPSHQLLQLPRLPKCLSVRTTLPLAMSHLQTHRRCWLHSTSPRRSDRPRILPVQQPPSRPPPVSAPYFPLPVATSDRLSLSTDLSLIHI